LIPLDILNLSVTVFELMSIHSN